MIKLSRKNQENIKLFLIGVCIVRRCVQAILVNIEVGEGYCDQRLKARARITKALEGLRQDKTSLFLVQPLFEQNTLDPSNVRNTATSRTLMNL